MRKDRVNIPWEATIRHNNKGTTKSFATREEALVWLDRMSFIGPRKALIAELRGLLWAELHARLAFKGAEIISTRSPKFRRIA